MTGYLLRPVHSSVSSLGLLDLHEIEKKHMFIVPISPEVSRFYFYLPCHRSSLMGNEKNTAHSTSYWVHEVVWNEKFAQHLISTGTAFLMTLCSPSKVIAHLLMT